MNRPEEEEQEKEASKTDQSKSLPNDPGAGLFDMGAAIGGEGGEVIGNNNPGRTFTYNHKSDSVEKDPI